MMATQDLFEGIALGVSSGGGSTEAARLVDRFRPRIGVRSLRLRSGTHEHPASIVDGPTVRLA